MNPSEGGLRPQLLDRFGLLVNVVTVENEQPRSNILQNVLRYEAGQQLEGNVSSGDAVEAVQNARLADQKLAEDLKHARIRFESMKKSIPPELPALCMKVSQKINVEGHRADYIMALAALASAARRGDSTATPEDVLAISSLALPHRQRSGNLSWDEERG
jgi:magnesium chelatase subunit I